MDISSRIKSMKDNLTESEKKISKYILENPSKVYKYSIKDLAKLIGTSTSSIVRFCQKLGYERFQDFKINLAIEQSNIEEEKTVIYEDVRLNDNIDEIVDKISMLNIKSIEDIKDFTDRKELERAIEVLNKADSIYLYGIGASGLVAMDFQYKLMRIGKKALMYLDTHSQLASTVNISKGDAAIAISHSGKTVEVYKAVEKAKNLGATIISITKYGNNPISKKSDIKLQVGDIERTLRVGAIASRIAQLTIIDILLMGLVKSDYPNISEKLIGSSNMVEDFKLK